MKIRTAIFVVYVAASAIGFAVLMRFILAEVRPRYVNSLQRTLDETAHIVAALLEPRSGESHAEAIARLRNLRSELRVTVQTEGGTVLFDSAPVESLAGDYAPESGRGIAKRVANHVIEAGSVAAKEVSGAAGFSLGPAERGVVTVSRPLRSVNAVIWAERKKLALIALLIAGAMIAAGWWIAAKLTRSLERLTTYVEALRDGRTATLPPSRAAEIAALGTAFEELREALEGKAYIERYTQALTHEIKAPLTAIRGAAELLHESMPLEERTRFLAHLRAESDRIQQIVDRLLQLSAIEARRGLQDTEVLPMHAVVAEVVEALRASARSRRVRVEICPGAGETDAAPIRVRGERFLLVQALMNLVQNAIEFSPENACVRVQATVLENRVCVEITDEGPGVPDYALARIFERFYSLPRPDTQRKSTGLGLSFVREIAALHGGQVTVANRAGGGACAVLQLPLA